CYHHHHLRIYIHCSLFIIYSLFFFFTDPSTTEIYTLSLHDALPIYLVLKRTVDLCLSAFALVFLCPLLTVIAVMIRLEDGGPVFYRGVRVGRGGVPFRIFKFRTMVVNAERLGGPSTADDDPRVTRIGRWRRSSIRDELPQ